MMLAQAAPSSALRAPSPRGGEGRARLPHRLSITSPRQQGSKMDAKACRKPLPPSGRRCRQADEGAVRMTKNQDIRERHTP